MKKILFFIILTVFIQNVNGQAAEYDSVLARKLGADEYGMKRYVLIILKTGTNTTVSGAARDTIFRGHLANIGRLAGLGKLVIAGPLEENAKSYQGIFIFNVPTIDEARELLKTDPAVKARLLDAELYEWYGSAAISEYLPVHDRITKHKF